MGCAAPRRSQLAPRRFTRGRTSPLGSGERRPVMNPWTPFQFLMGSWSSPVAGQPGAGYQAQPPFPTTLMRRSSSAEAGQNLLQGPVRNKGRYTKTCSSSIGNLGSRNSGPFTSTMRAMSSDPAFLFPPGSRPWFSRARPAAGVPLRGWSTKRRRMAVYWSSFL